MPPTNLFGLGFGVGPAGYGYPSAGSVAPPTLSYASPQSWTYGAAISTLSPTTTGATSFAVTSGALPTGISLDAGTGVLSGTPTQSKVAANVEITATGPGGSIAATINIEVPSPLYTSLVDYWNLDEASGTRVGSHAALNLTDNNTVTSQATGGPDGGRCAQFTRANAEYLSRASQSALQVSGDFTVVAWVRLDTSSSLAGGILTKGSPTNAEYCLWELNDGAFRFESSTDGTSGTRTLVTDGGGRTTGVWYMVVGWVDTAAQKIRIQVNNGTIYEAAFTGTPYSGSSDLMVGVMAGYDYVDGRSAYCLLTKRVLTASEKTWLWNSGAGRAYSALATYDGG